MDAHIAHDVSRSHLKQRNILVLVVLALTILLLITFFAANVRDREIVLQPVITKEMAISTSGVTPDYLEAVSRDAAQLILNRSPETLKYWLDSVLAITAPQQRGKLKQELIQVVKQQEGSQITQFVTIDFIRVDPDALTSEVGGVLHTVVGSREVRKQHRVFKFQWSYEGLSLKLAGFGVSPTLEERKQ